MNTFRVIDADGHITDTDAIFEKHLEEEFMARRPRVGEDNNGRNRWLVEGVLYPRPVGYGCGLPDPTQKAKGSPRAGGFDPHLRVKDMDADGIEIAALFSSLSAAVFAGMHDLELSAACCRAYNDWLTEYASAYPGASRERLLYLSRTSRRR